MNLDDFKKLLAADLGYAEKDKKHCVACRKEFSNENVYSTEGWQETLISGLCELCFDDITNPRD